MESNMNANVVVEEEETEEEEDGDWAESGRSGGREEITSQAATKRAVKKAEKLVYVGCLPDYSNRDEYRERSCV